MKKKILSSLQPSGSINIGNYIGAIQRWSTICNNSKNLGFFSIADLHALTNKNNYPFNKKKYLDFMALYLSSGIDYKNNVFFIQSDIPQHTELHWIFSCLTSINHLYRMTQFKEKISKKCNSDINLGILSYPILMACDILLYDADYVIVGEDQIQHVEITQYIASFFNKKYNKIFSKPIVYLKNKPIKIMGLQYPEKKMSKSDISSLNSINILDDSSLISKKIFKSITDSENQIYIDKNKKPGITNLINIISYINNISPNTYINFFQKEKFNYRKLKEFVIKQVLQYIKNIQEKYQYFRSQEKLLINILNEGKNIAKKIAYKKIKKIKKILQLGI